MCWIKGIPQVLAGQCLEVSARIPQVVSNVYRLDQARQLVRFGVLSKKSGAQANQHSTWRPKEAFGHSDWALLPTGCARR